MNYIDKIRHSSTFAGIAVILLGLMYGALALVYAALSAKEPVALFSSYLHMPSLVALNIAPVVLFALIFWLISGRVWVSSLLTGLLFIAPSCVNYVKILLRGDCLVAKDIFLIAEALKISETYSNFLRFPVFFAGFVIVFATIFCAWFFKAKLTHNRYRYGGLLAVIAICAVLYNTVYTKWEVYDDTENIERNSWFMSQWSDADQHASRGFVYPFIYSFQSISVPAPEGYDKIEIENLLSSLPEGDIPDDKQISVMGVMLEAFADFSDFGFEITNDPYENWHRLESEGYHGDLVTNIFAGGTIDSERAFLTGQTRLWDYRKSAYSYVHFFDEQGYKTEGGHPSYGWFYNRQNVNSYLGFDDYWFYETKYGEPTMDTYSGMMIDYEFYGDLLNMFDSATADGSPYFQFSVTYQNHGPYSTDEIYFNEEYVEQTETLSDEGYRIINNYLSGIKQSDVAVGYLADELEKRDTPVVLVLFGDHKPWLGNGSYVYGELGIDINLGDGESFENYYGTSYIIWANSAAREIIGEDYSGEGEQISPCYLMNKVFDVCGFEPPPVMQVSNDLQEILPVATTVGAYWEDVNFTTKPSDEAMKMLTDWNKIEYYLANDWER